MVIVGAVVVGMVLLYVVFHGVYLATRPKGATALVASHPMPRLFAESAVAPYAAPLDAEAAQAHRLMQPWWHDHGTHRHDRAFAAWLKKTLPPPPSPAARKAEIGRLKALNGHRTVADTQAAQWLLRYGSRDVWLYYGQQAQGGKQAQGKQADPHARRQLHHALALAHRVGPALTKQLQQSAPYVLDPSLKAIGHGHGHGHSTGVCPCSYPSEKQASAAAAETFLSAVYPARAAQYHRVADALGYAQLYTDGRLPSDVDTGQLLGDMIGQYFLVTRAHLPA